MSRFVRINAVPWFALLLTIAPSACKVSAQDRTSPAAANDEQGHEQILVLRDGGVLTGRIAREGESYVVTRSGGRLQVAAQNVLFVCGSLEEAYSHRRQQLTRPTAEAHLALADWCLRYGLVAEAGRELRDAQALDARHPRLALLERRLARARHQPGPTAAESATKPQSPPITISGQPETTATDVSPQVVERFTRKVQPVLVNNCTASGCHQRGGAQAFQLDRALLHGLANRRSTMNNLAATLALVDRERPQLSRLLTVPRRGHGGMDGPVFGPRQEQAYRHLVEWVALATQSDSSKLQAKPSSTETDAELLAVDAEAPAQSVTETATEGVVQTNHDENAPALAPATQRVRFGAQVEKWQPRDPFDPEIFNRRVSKRQTASAKESNARQDER